MLRMRSISRTVTIVVIILILLLLIGAYVYYFGGVPQTTTTPTTTTTSSVTTQTTTTTTTTTTGGITLVIITRHDTTIQDATKKMFLQSDIAKKFNIVDLKFLPVAAGLWKDYISSGGVDVAWGGGPTLFDTILSMNLLAPITDNNTLNVISQIPNTIGGVPMKRFNDKGQIMWVAAAISSFGFTVNNDKLQAYKLPKPSKWSDLASDVYGELLPIPTIGVANPLASTSNTRIYEIILQAYGWTDGWKILTLMAANAKIYDTSDAVRDAVITGDVPVGITIDFYGYNAMFQNPKTEYIIPTNESIINGDPIALVKGAPHAAAAQAFIAWVLSAEGQKLWLNPNINRMPANPAVFRTPEGQQRQDLYKLYNMTIANRGIDFNDTRALVTEYAMMNYFKSVLIDANTELKQAWSAVLSLKDKNPQKYQELKEKLTTLLQFKDPITGNMVSFTESYAASINNRLQTDTSFLNQITSTWRDAARNWYLNIYNEAKAAGA
ncbi:MAG: ABC transporter substrate-binding protein [Thermoprotei archaeon]